MEVVPNKRHLLTWLRKSAVQRQEIEHVPKQKPAGRDNFIHLRGSGDFSDAVIRVEGVEFHVHRNIMACCSDYFRAVFEDKRQLSQGYIDALPSNPDDGQGVGGNTEGRQYKGGPSTPDDPSPVSIRCLTDKPKPCVFITSSKKSIAENCLLSRNVRHRFEVTITDISPAIMNQILDHAYGGHVTVTQDNVEKLLTAADRFQISSLVQECCFFLTGQLSVENCISIIKFAINFYECHQLVRAATQFLLENFEAVYQISTEFQQLSFTELSSVLSDDNLNVRDEESTLKAIIKWGSADYTSRADVISSLVECVRVGLMLPAQIGRFFAAVFPPFDGLNKQIVMKVRGAVFDCQKRLIEGIDYTPMRPRLPKDLMFIVGGSNFGFPLGITEVFDCRACRWNIMGTRDFAPRSYHGLVCLNREIYIVGGFDGQSYLSTCSKFCPEEEIVVWENVTPMNTKRCYVGVASVKGAIYAVGGYDGQCRLNSAERFDAKSSQWSFIAPMSQQRSDAGVAVLNDKMYVCGGFSGTECISSMEMYDPDTKAWSHQSSMLNRRSGLGVAAYKGCLYAIGGFNGVDSLIRLSTMDVYDPMTRQWTSLSPMPHPRSNLAVAVLEDTLYSIGGYNGDRTSGVVECYDFRTDTWYQSTKLSKNRSALSVCVVSDLPNRAEILGRSGSNDYRKHCWLQQE